MELKEFKNIELAPGCLIECMLKDELYVRIIRPMYYLNLREEVAEFVKSYNPSPPFMEVALFKDKNGAHRDMQKYRLEEILWIKRKD